MLISAKMPSASTQQKLESELLRYLTSIKIREFTLDAQLVNNSIAQHFPSAYQQFKESGSLSCVGISHIFFVTKHHEKTIISCSITDSENLAQEQLQTFQSSDYLALRQELGIHSHWIFLVPDRNIALNSHDEFIDCYANFEDDGKPSCWITDVY